MLVTVHLCCGFVTCQIISPIVCDVCHVSYVCVSVCVFTCALLNVLVFDTHLCLLSSPLSDLFLPSVLPLWRHLMCRRPLLVVARSQTLKKRKTQTFEISIHSYFFFPLTVIKQCSWRWCKSTTGKSKGPSPTPSFFPPSLYLSLSHSI